MTYTPPPTQLPGFPEARVVERKTRITGAGLRKRWRNPDGTILEWDGRHAAVEMYDSRGQHMGEFDSLTGDQLKPANPERRIDP